MYTSIRDDLKTKLLVDGWWNGQKHSAGRRPELKAILLSDCHRSRAVPGHGYHGYPSIHGAQS